jgi:hypothetical protein
MLGTNKPPTPRAQVSWPCPVCGEPFTRSLAGRKRKFCSDACRQEARRTISFSVLSHCPGLSRNDAKSDCGTGTFSLENRGRGSGGIVGPRNVIAIEIDAALTWTPLVPGGAILVAQLRRSPLVKP